MESIVENYINSEINYIENEIDYRDYEMNKKSYDEDLKFLKSLKEEDFDKITELVENDDELEKAINETIHYYLYHYKK